MVDQAINRLYERLGDRYPIAFEVFEQISALSVAGLAVLLLSAYYGPSAGQLAVMFAVAGISTMGAVTWALWRGMPLLAKLFEWRRTEAPDEQLAIDAWDAATNFSMRSYRANAVCVSLIISLPVIAVIMIELDLGVGALPVLLVSCVLPSAYGTVLNYVISETLMRPLVSEIARTLPDEFPFTANGLLIRHRLKLVAPVFTSFAGLVVAAILLRHGGTRLLGESVAVALGVGLILSFELTALLSQSVTVPISALRAAVRRVRDGDYDVRVPVVTSDELGELSHDFNRMTAGLAERKRIRDAFEAYHDADVVPFILSGTFPREGVSVTVSVMFVDVRGFTSFAERAEPTEVVGRLNELFETMVPIVRKHGGHVDKFLGDGMLVVFGAPEGFIDHADRAVAAGCEILGSVNGAGARLTVGVGVNTGTCIVGSIGGAGRFNFSVIGDAVNVAARVEAATRQTGDGMLITAHTRDSLRGHARMHPRGFVDLKGKAEAVEVFALEGTPADSERPATVGALDGHPAAEPRSHLPASA